MLLGGGISLITLSGGGVYPAGGVALRWCYSERTDQAHVTSSQTVNSRSSQPR